MIDYCAVGRNYCVVCKTQCDSNLEFQSHALTHLKIRCPLCNKMCSTGLRLTSHIRNNHASVIRKPNTCIPCGKSFSSSNSIWVHKKSVHKNTNNWPFKCSICSYGTEDRILLEYHMEQAGENHNEFKCDCGKILSTQNNLDRHIRLFHSIQKCSLCHKEYSTRNNLLRHMQRSHGRKRDRNVTCPYCTKKFFANWQLKGHLVVHDNKTLQCSQCDYQTVFPQSLKIHEKRHSPQCHQSNLCSFCGKTFLSGNILKNHLAKEHLDIKIQCKNCSKTFHSTKNLKLHMVCHQPGYNDRNYSCDVKDCGKTFLRRSMLRRHIRVVHDGLAPSYKCEYCSKTLSSKMSLRDHTKIHSGLRPYQCEICQQTFARKNYLISHIRIHTKEKPYHCNVCGVAFSQRGALTIHRKKHSTD